MGAAQHIRYLMQIPRPAWLVQFKVLGTYTTYSIYTAIILGNSKLGSFSVLDELKVHNLSISKQSCFSSLLRDWHFEVSKLSPLRQNALSLVLTHKMTFPTKAKMIYVQNKTKKKELTAAWVCCWIIAPGHAEHSARDGKYHCFGWVWRETPVWIVGKREGCSCMWSEGYVNREVRTRPGPVGTSSGWVNNRQIGELIVFWE